MTPSNGNGSLSSLPAWARVVSLVGVPSAIALFLTWIIVSGVQADLATIKGSQAALSYNMWRICLHTSTNDLERATCLPPK